ncbi:hypothetical protein BS78_06G109700 [Paspalum vaginatum]|nr:hypothetical protein BS78_06G109700 [Paspalum vaginatum]
MRENPPPDTGIQKAIQSLQASRQGGNTTHAPSHQSQQAPMAARLVSVSLILLLVLACSRAAPASETVEQTCAKATSGARRAELAPFCVSSLQAAPGSDGADARGLAAIATNLTLANYTAAVATIKALERRGGWPEPARRALAACRLRYIEALNVVHSAVHALATGRLTDYVSDMGVVGKAAADCEDAFAAAGNAAQSPLRKVDEDAGNLTVVAALIVASLEK